MKIEYSSITANVAYFCTQFKLSSHSVELIHNIGYWNIEIIFFYSYQTDSQNWTRSDGQIDKIGVL